MLTILPADRKDILSNENIEYSENITVFVCCEDEKEKGYAVIKQIGYIIDILSLCIYSENNGNIQITNALIYYDSILRAIGSFALNHSCYYVECSKIELFPTLSSLRFSQENEKMRATLDRLLGH